MEHACDAFMARAAKLLSNSVVGTLMFVLFAVWLACGPLCHWSDTFMLVGNTVMSAVAYLAMPIFSNTQARDTAANQVQQGEMIRAIPGARNELIGLEGRTPAEIAEARAVLVEAVGE